MKKLLPVLAMAMRKPRAITCELKCSQLSSLTAPNSSEEKKFNIQKSTAGIGNGCEQAKL
jgi:hypothetical protein